MEKGSPTSIAFYDISNNLFNYAIDRKEMQLVLNNLPESVENNRNILEYELQLLRILAVGWAIAFFMFEKPGKDVVLESFWEKIRDFSDQLSSTVALTSATNVNYFDVLKIRTNIYVNSIASAAGLEPIAIVGPVFARVCSLEGDACVILLGAKLFRSTIDAVRDYLDLL